MPDDNSSVAAMPEPVAPMEPVSDVTTPVEVPNPVIVEPELPDVPVDAPEEEAIDVKTEVVRKIGEAHNVLIALSADPSVDEMSAAIGLSLFLDKLGKRATAIYSGATPNALEFLKPEETFESTADALQDFVIALNKEKADHLRYKLDGDYVKVYITPYRTRISEEDLDYSYGDFNIDLVLALDVANGVDLDSALREHGRIMHDAAIVNITTGNPGKLGEIEWSDKSASSVSEMIAKLLYSINGATIEKEEATAFLTGIVAATNRFSNAGTTPDTMKLASKLMESGANQQLISKNITPDVENEMMNMLSADLKASGGASDGDSTKLDIEHGHEAGVDESKEVDATISEKESTLLDDLKAAEASLAQAGDETVPDDSNKPLEIDSNPGASNLEVPEGIEEEAAKLENEPSALVTTVQSDGVEPPAVEAETEAGTAGNGYIVGAPTDNLANAGTAEPVTGAPVVENTGVEPMEGETIVAPPVDTGTSSFVEDDGSKYGQMLEDALANAGPMEPTAPIMSPNDNPAAMSAPNVPGAPEINGVPEINYMPMPGDTILPPPPAPMPLGPQPAMQDQVYTPQAVDPNAFKIPGT